MKKLIGFAAVAAAAMVMTGCTTAPQNFSDASLPVEQGKYTVVGEEVEGSDSQLMVLGYGIGLPGSPQRRALKSALDKAPGADGLVSMAVDYQLLNLYLVQVLTTRITGTPIKTNNK